MSRSKTARDVFAGLARGFGGSILFALPLLMTMEMWWLGFYLAPARILLLMAVFFPVLIGVAHYIGFGDTASVGHAALHAITAYGVAIVSSGVMLGILGVFKPGMGWHELVGKVAIQAGPGALGALLAESHFGESDDKGERREQAAYIEHLFFMVVGALFVALTVAPTDEMPLIGYMMRDAQVNPWPNDQRPATSATRRSTTRKRRRPETSTFRKGKLSIGPSARTATMRSGSRRPA